MEKEIAFEVLKVTKTEPEKGLEKALKDFNDMCSIYEKVLVNSPVTKVIIESAIIGLTKEIIKKTDEMREDVIRNVGALKKR